MIEPPSQYRLMRSSLTRLATTGEIMKGNGGMAWVRSVTANPALSKPNRERERSFVQDWRSRIRTPSQASAPARLKENGEAVNLPQNEAEPVPTGAPGKSEQGIPPERRRIEEAGDNAGRREPLPNPQNSGEMVEGGGTG